MECDKFRTRSWGIDVLIKKQSDQLPTIHSTLIRCQQCHNLPPQSHSLATGSWLLSCRNLVPIGEQDLNDPPVAAKLRRSAGS